MRRFTTCYISITTTLLFIAATTSSAQDLWHLEKANPNRSFGASVYDAYKHLEHKKPTPIIVAVIDNGTDINHKDLKPYIWTNPKETANNNKDDDGNGYADDVHGWNFMGGAKADIDYEALEETRKYQRIIAKYADSTKLSDSERKVLRNAYSSYERGNEERKSSLKYATFIDKNKKAPLLKTGALLFGGKGAVRELSEMKLYAEKELEYNYMNSDSLRRSIVGDDPLDTDNKHYGNNHLDAGDPSHGTHTAGIIAGIAKVDKHNGDWLKIIALRAVPVDGDERDKDVANAIRYAVDNGAKVISMSFGKHISPQREYVAAAIKYAEEHDVLLVHGSGNEAKQLDSAHKRNFPNYWLDSTTRVYNWIEVGASGNSAKKLVAGFSNYGRKSVDILAPGVQIYSTIPGDKYEYMSGTSMATPVVAGIAAMIRSYYPQLTAQEVRELLMKNVTTTNKYVNVPSTNWQAQLWYFCKAAGIINAEKAVLAAEKMLK
ncbi:MAG: S8 family serine peptidase [Chitinophagales bacterium]|nr:S8 family serine peptidase [Chitinophagales bacterium]